ncbi:pyocin S6 family toxin immunity protein [Pseudomonas putida]|uniref:pyocin S6 family toxin immunity protein n=1 Tax=Pseudomonas putida TaxID=303 RepID=UPI0011479AB5|nr:pyocin S6 family toxin immunity protein [Pseudomonas putida]
MYISLTGFLKDDSLDNSLKFRLRIPYLNEKDIMSLLNWQSLEAESDGELPLSDEQAEKIFSLLGNPKPEGLDFFVGVRA